MHMQKFIYSQVYKRLLTDVSKLSGVSLDIPDDCDDEWALIQAPLLDKALLQWIENGGDFPSFPEWLSPLARKFEHSPNDARTLALLRQCLVFCYKVEKEPTDEQLKTAQAAFVDTDVSIGVWDTAFLQCLSHHYRYVEARRLISQVIAWCDWSEIDPKHGPGAVFPSFDPWERSDFTTIYDSIQAHYPFDRYFIEVPSLIGDVLCGVNENRIVESRTIVAKLVAVPKDSRGPRLICVHPREAIWIQQGQRLVLENAIARSPLTREAISFNDQRVNGTKALEASLNREYCTLDLSEASDRLSCTLIRFLLGDYVYEKLSCSRAVSVMLLDGSSHQLRKWAPMGNALCFPVESLVFWALVRSAIYSRHGVSCDNIYVFGDDIIFPTAYYDCVVETLVMSGLKPNVSKTFRRGSFRESCGVDAFRGFNITPLRMRQGDVVTYASIESNCNLAKRLRLAGYEETSSYLYSACRRSLRSVGRALPISNNVDGQGLYEYVLYDLAKVLRYDEHTKWRADHHYWATRVIKLRTRTDPRPHSAWWHLADSLRRCRSSSYTTGCIQLTYEIPYSQRPTYGWLEHRYVP